MAISPALMPTRTPILASFVCLAVVEQHTFLDGLASNYCINGGVEHGEGSVAEILNKSAAGGGEGVADDAVMLDTDLVRNVISKHARACALNRQGP